MKETSWCEIYMTANQALPPIYPELTSFLLSRPFPI